MRLQFYISATKLLITDDARVQPETAKSAMLFYVRGTGTSFEFCFTGEQALTEILYMLSDDDVTISIKKTNPKPAHGSW